MNPPLPANAAAAHLLDWDRAELERFLAEQKLPAFRGTQILHWVYQRRVTRFEEMTNLPQALRATLTRSLLLRSARVLQTRRCADQTVKLLLQWPDQTTSETVFMPQEGRRSVCVSTQVGCPVGCAFCASGQHGWQRHLAAGEMVEQVLWAAAQLPPDERVSHVVVMGMGEPLANYDATLKALRILNASWGLNIGARHLTLSTVGLPEGIRRLAAEPLQLTLAVSLHAPTDDLRGQLIPWARKIPLGELFAAIDAYFAATGREVTLEYVLLEGVNTSDAQADALAELALGSRCNVNLINYHAVAGAGYVPATPATRQRFLARLRGRGVNVHLRRSRGADIDAACGQLRARLLEGAGPQPTSPRSNSPPAEC